MFWLGVYVGGFVVTFVNCVFGFYGERAVYKAAGTKTKLPVIIVLACILTIILWPLLLVYALVTFGKDNVYGPFLSIINQEGSVGVVETVEEPQSDDEFKELKRKLMVNTGVDVGVKKENSCVVMIVCIRCDTHYELDLTKCPNCGFKSAGMLG